MKFSAYMYVRNGIRAGYTFMEAIESVLPFVDEFFILDGQSDDGTLEALESLGKLNAKIRIESNPPAYLNAPRDEKGLLLGAAFDEARQKCEGDWLVQVQADTVFHPVTMLAVRDFLVKKGNDWNYDAIEIVRNQYRWNWQEMYRKDHLALIFKKTAGKVSGDAINIAITGRISRRFVALFERFPVADNAWTFFENLAGKQEGCREIWLTPENSDKDNAFPWYDKATNRSFSADLATFREKGELPPFWHRTTTPFKDILPANLLELVGSSKYFISGRFVSDTGLYTPSVENIAAMRTEAEKFKPCFLLRTLEYSKGCLFHLLKRGIRANR